MGLGPGNPGAEGHLAPDVAQSGFTIELAWRPRLLSAGGEEEDGKGKDGKGGKDGKESTHEVT
jgi:hypothetical protein